MANIKISQLPVAAALTGAEEVPVVQSGITVKTTVADILVDTGTVESVAALTLGTTGTDLSSTVANPTTTPVITLNVPTASATNRGALASADWSTFNGKQAALSSGVNIKTVSGTSLLGAGDLGAIGVAYGGTGQTSYTNGQLLIGNTTGNTLVKATLTAGSGISISNGAGSITISSSITSAPTLNVVTGTSQAAVAGTHYVLTNVAATTVTLPATPAAGEILWVTVGNGLTTNVVARNGSNIQSLAEDLTLDATYAAVQMRYINSTIGWTFV